MRDKCDRTAQQAKEWWNSPGVMIWDRIVYNIGILLVFAWSSDFFSPKVLKCESCQFLGVRLTWDSCIITVEDIKMCQASSLVWNSNFFRILFYLLKVLLVMVSGKANKQTKTKNGPKTFSKRFASNDKHVLTFFCSCEVSVEEGFPFWIQINRPNNQITT